MIELWTDYSVQCAVFSPLKSTTNSSLANDYVRQHNAHPQATLIGFTQETLEILSDGYTERPTTVGCWSMVTAHGPCTRPSTKPRHGLLLCIIAFWS